MPKYCLEVDLLWIWGFDTVQIRSNKDVLEARRALQNIKIVFFKCSPPAGTYKNCRKYFSFFYRPQDPSKTANSDFVTTSIFFVIRQRGPDLLYCFWAPVEIDV